MTITSVVSATYISDLVVYLRDYLSNNITDPIAAKRPSNSKFILTEYPRRECVYPVITVVDRNSKQEQKLGMQSEGTVLRVTIEIRLWGRNVKERDELFCQVHDFLRTHQDDSGGLNGANLHDFKLTSVVNISEENTKSKVMELSFLFLCL
jgi:hypothetical protein